jgi:hypothetical protein
MIDSIKNDQSNIDTIMGSIDDYVESRSQRIRNLDFDESDYQRVIDQFSNKSVYTFKNSTTYRLIVVIFITLFGYTLSVGVDWNRLISLLP